MPDDTDVPDDTDAPDTDNPDTDAPDTKNPDVGPPTSAGSPRAAASGRPRARRPGATPAPSPEPAPVARRRAPRPSRRHTAARLGRPATGVVVTGGASGIGAATCRALAEVGRAVSVWDRDAAGARRVARSCSEEFGVTAVGVGVDVTDTAALATVVRRTRSALGGIGGFVHAAGVSGPAPVTDLNEAAWDEVLAVNLRAAALLTRALAPALVEAGPGSAVVYVSSIEAFFGSTWLAAYCSSKAGVLGLTRSAAHTLGPDGIRVNAVCPGAVDTPMLAPLLSLPGARAALESRTPLGRVAEPGDIGRVVRFLLSEEAGFVTGASLVADGGLSAVNGV